MLNVIKRSIILSLRLQSGVLWFYALGTMFVASLLLCIFFPWAFCFYLQIRSRIWKQRMPFSVQQFYGYWLICCVTDSIIILISDLHKLKLRIDSANNLAFARSIPYNWNFLTRWANTPILWKYLTQFGFRETSIGPPNLILDMAIGELKEPSWTDVV